MSLRPVGRAHQQRRVAGRPAGTRGRSRRSRRRRRSRASTSCDVADADARDPDRLALAGDDRLGRLELGLQLERLLLEDRDPQALLLEDVERVTAPATTSRTATAMKSRRCLRIATAISRPAPCSRSPRQLALPAARAPGVPPAGPAPPRPARRRRPPAGPRCGGGLAPQLRGGVGRQQRDVSSMMSIGPRGRPGSARRAPRVAGGDCRRGEVRRLLGLAGDVWLELRYLRVAESPCTLERRPAAGSREADRVGAVGCRSPGSVTVLAPPPAWTRMYWPFASPERLSPAIPTRP